MKVQNKILNIKLQAFSKIEYTFGINNASDLMAFHDFMLKIDNFCYLLKVYLNVEGSIAKHIIYGANAIRIHFSKTETSSYISYVLQYIYCLVCLY